MVRLSIGNGTVDDRMEVQMTGNLNGNGLCEGFVVGSLGCLRNTCIWERWTSCL